MAADAARAQVLDLHGGGDGRSYPLLLWGAGALVALLLLRALWREVLPTSWKPLSAGRILFDSIGSFYDASTGIWLKVWGEHLHTGFYTQGVDTSRWTLQQHIEAQERMMQELIGLWPQQKSGGTLRVLDMGCGVGGSCRFLYRYLRSLGFEVRVTGITLSTYQCKRAGELAAACPEIPAGAVTFQVANALHTPFPDGSFDLVWSLEAGEHIPDKAVWLAEVRRVLRAGGNFVCATWCHREVDMYPLTRAEQCLLERICKNYALPAWVPLSEYGKVAGVVGFAGFEATERSWTVNVLPFWPAVIRSSLRPYSIFRLLIELPFGGWATVKGAITAILMMKGFKTGTLNFGAFALQKT